MNKKITSIVTALAVGATILTSMPLIASADNPLPAITSMSPSTAVAGSQTFTLNVYGINFVPGSSVRFNGIPVATTYVSSTQLSATVPASAIALAENQAVSVQSPTPGGGTTASLIFTVSSLTPGLPDTGAGPVATPNQMNVTLALAGALASLLAISFVALRRTVPAKH